MADHKNTTYGWILFAGIVALGSTLVIGEAFHGTEAEPCDEEGNPTGDGYATASICAATVAAGGAEAEEPIAFYLASADATRGEATFKKCTACHNAAPGGANALGPNIHNIMGADIAGKAGFAYSDALSGVDGAWDWENMSAWLKSPRGFVAGNKMTFAGLGDPQDRADVMLWLNQQGSGIAIPPPPAASDEEAAAEGAAADGELQPAQDSDTADELTEESVEGTGSEGGVGAGEDDR